MAVIKFFNTLSRQVEDFQPIQPGRVGLYSCGPTVYHYAHIGNLRAYVFSDLLRRMLEYNQFQVTQVINITDVGHLVSDGDTGEDKLEKAAKNEGRSAAEIAAFYLAAWQADLAALNIETANTIFPKATEHLKEQIDLIKTLETKGFTYQTSDGVYFDTAKDPHYAELAKLDLAGLKAGARVEENNEKRNPSDFALWKFSSQESQRQQEWPSPWGVGFPGWHIECSAMSMKYLGTHFDIHTGGIDHIPVHHTNERAQSECATGEPFVNYWLHVGFVNIDSEKMSKSLGNFYRLADLVSRGFSPLTYRYWLLTASYHTTLNFTWPALEAAQTAYNKLKQEIAALDATVKPGKVLIEWQEKFLAAINDDLNTAQSLALGFALLKDNTVLPADKLATLLDFDHVWGLELDKVDQPEEIPQTILDLITKREKARGNQDFAAADQLRQEIATFGYTVEDTPAGPKAKKQVK